MNLVDVYNNGLKKVVHLKNELDGRFPHITKNGKWLTNTDGHWTGGFWTGLLWLNYLGKKETVELKEQAVQQALKLAVRMDDNKTHDMGFIFGPSCVFGHNIEARERFVEMARAGAHNMEDLFEEEVELVRAWDEPGYEGNAIVDTIMNAPIMIWAARAEDNEVLYEKGIRLANSIMKNHIRDDYSIYHMVKWDTKTFEIIERTTHQGYLPETCWSRGQAWALYGFANMYRYTGNKAYLDTAKNLANYYWNNVDDETKLPRWDFHFKNVEEEPIDAAASSIATSGMLLISHLLKEENEQKSLLWKERSKQIIDSMVEHCFFQSYDKFGIIEKSTVDKPRNSGVNESAMYGDYYFMEALYRYLNYGDEEAISLLY
ncbi:glycoside hydrolase family 88 protein [Sporosarcina highlanderae]|uniref:Glycoside hydrolase family 88 protein n=1 Tax=Sporosarcina highlanderae TaxID=3035916 RepID=A0ABT8JL62_9BACL|nr:glycoside hydrolase family 88 protein [Sporosarcina highlanderae]MDN4605889.1 glycoside hydrolase family 88 protein [Sporosarcina highlanderae]